jgi:hypothetical protein
MDTSRTIEQVLALRLRAAQLRVLERITALVKEYEVVQQSWTHEQDQAEHAKLLDAKRLADDDVQLVQREIRAQQAGAEPPHYDPASNFATRRYAAILMQDNAELTAEAALAQASADERIRFEDHMTRAYGSNWANEPTEA